MPLVVQKRLTLYEHLNSPQAFLTAGFSHRRLLVVFMLFYRHLSRVAIRIPSSPFAVLAGFICWILFATSIIMIPFSANQHNVFILPMSPKIVCAFLAVAHGKS
jgi:hypothetical protein